MKLLEKTTLGGQPLKNSMVMAAMTRSRAGKEGIVDNNVIEYYTQRISAGLILTEAINISADAIGSPYTPGLFTDEQIEAWKKVTQSVHDNNGLIYAQLWHTGRMGHSVDRKGLLPVAPSAIRIEGVKHFTSEGLKDFETPRELTSQEIKQTIQDYKQAAINAMKAGFDGVELHAANGYLPDQFLSDSANTRTDEYGGSIENKSRFILEIMAELINAIDGSKVGIKLSPFQPYGGISYDNPVESHRFLISELNKLDFAFIEIMKRSPSFPLLSHYPKSDEIEVFGSFSKHTIIANTGYSKETGEAELTKGIAKLISYGSLFLANPDLPTRFKLNADLNMADPKTMFGGNEKGYTDYPFLNED